MGVHDGVVIAVVELAHLAAELALALSVAELALRLLVAELVFLLLVVAPGLGVVVMLEVALVLASTLDECALGRHDLDLIHQSRCERVLHERSLAVEDLGAIRVVYPHYKDSQEDQSASCL
ncbi:hypothetical protein PF011_g4962 [Phytophthora fragariae]|uniref:Uncharacterized protein n=1 Tax=Phytophthora fragariae TaxID=53985 RepID=A0A6A3LTC1_9STRA|nr:hypothetical protein PF011_g4962 [Phytophthora fragariae]